MAYGRFTIQGYAKRINNAPQQVITDFTYASLDAGVSTTEVRFGSAGSLQGGEAYYPNSGTYPLTVDVTQSNYHITGTVGDYSGIRLYFDNCDHLDASQFEGISFTISGSVQGDAIQFGVVSAGNTPTWSWLKANGKTDAKETDIGRCTPSETTNNQYYHPGCDDPTAPIPVTSTPTTNRVTWDKLTGGKPEPSPNPKEITAIYWVIPWSGTGAPYAVDLVLDDLHFFP